MIFGWTLETHRKWLDWQWKAVRIFIYGVVPFAIVVIAVVNVRNGDDLRDTVIQAVIMLVLSQLFMIGFWLMRLFLHGVFDFIEVVGRKK